ncbi:MAG TPA: hypothetical protein VEB64_04685 [Azospirillaceae bacterium]|nr:hypothetical protein [Azospirillaceae bacterium]
MARRNALVFPDLLLEQLLAVTDPKPVLTQDGDKRESGQRDSGLLL